MKFTRVWTGNWENAFHGLRHPLESYDRGDTKWYADTMANEHLCGNQAIEVDPQNVIFLGIGPNDMDLAQRMIKAGTPNDKFLRQIFVSVDITAPLYWWKEMDTYKVGTTANSTSTMHKLASTPITMDCFETDDFNDVMVFDCEPYNPDVWIKECWEDLINIFETLRKKFNETKDVKYWKELIRILPESWLQTRTWTANYSILRNIYHWRKDHKLSEWHQFCDWIKTLPYAEDLIVFNN
jgi:hypothetical protein